MASPKVVEEWLISPSHACWKYSGSIWCPMGSVSSLLPPRQWPITFLSPELFPWLVTLSVPSSTLEKLLSFGNFRAGFSRYRNSPLSAFAPKEVRDGLKCCLEISYVVTFALFSFFFPDVAAASPWAPTMSPCRRPSPGGRRRGEPAAGDRW